MNKLIVRWAINAVALYVAVYLVPGIVQQSENPLSFIWMALIFGLLNALLRPLLKLLTCPLIMLTLGLFTLVINTIMFYIAGYIGTQFGVGFTIANFGAAVVGALIVSIVSMLLTFIMRDELDNKKKKKR
jgi:putative membrane protein